MEVEMTPETSGVRGAHESVDFRNVADAIPALLVCALPDGSVEFVNQSWREYTGRSVEGLAHWGWPSVVCSEDLPELIVEWDASRADGNSFEKETRVRRFDGRHRRFLIRIGPVLDETNQIIRWFGTGHDIEDLKSAQDQLRLAVDTAPALVHSARPDGYVDFLNKGWLDFLGLSMEEASGWHWTNAFHPDDVESCVGKWRAALATGEPFEAEGRVRRADGEYRTVAAPQITAARRTREHRQMVWIEHRHRGPKAGVRCPPP
jgi:PAS domain S-box-containing protein